MAAVFSMDVPTNDIYTFQTVFPPQINIAPSGGNLLLSWFLPSTNFALWQNSDLSTANWSLVTNAPAFNITNLEDQVFLAPSAGSAFYRLQAQPPAANP